MRCGVEGDATRLAGQQVALTVVAKGRGHTMATCNDGSAFSAPPHPLANDKTARPCSVASTSTRRPGPSARCGRSRASPPGLRLAWCSVDRRRAYTTTTPSPCRTHGAVASPLALPPRQDDHGGCVHAAVRAADAAVGRGPSAVLLTTMLCHRPAYRSRPVTSTRLRPRIDLLAHVPAATPSKRMRRLVGRTTRDVFRDAQRPGLCGTSEVRLARPSTPNDHGAEASLVMGYLRILSSSLPFPDLRSSLLHHLR